MQYILLQLRPEPVLLCYCVRPLLQNSSLSAVLRRDGLHFYNSLTLALIQFSLLFSHCCLAPPPPPLPPPHSPLLLPPPPPPRFSSHSAGASMQPAVPESLPISSLLPNFSRDVMQVSGDYSLLLGRSLLTMKQRIKSSVLYKFN